jgi:hypothetical protein
VVSGKKNPENYLEKHENSGEFTSLPPELVDLFVLA